jgi:hypothetical protein
MLARIFPEGDAIHIDEDLLAAEVRHEPVEKPAGGVATIVAAVGEEELGHGAAPGDLQAGLSQRNTIWGFGFDSTS